MRELRFAVPGAGFRARPKAERAARLGTGRTLEVSP